MPLHRTEPIRPVTLPAHVLILLEPGSRDPLPTLSTLSIEDLFHKHPYPWHLPGWEQKLKIADDTGWFLNYE